MHVTCLIQGTPSASQETSEKPRDHSSTSRTTPDGQVVVNYMEGKSTSYPGGSCDCLAYNIPRYRSHSANNPKLFSTECTDQCSSKFISCSF